MTAASRARTSGCSRSEDNSTGASSPVSTGRAEGYQFEHGPYALFDNEPALRELVAQIGLAPKLQQASRASGTRHVVLHGTLRHLPPGPKILTGGPLSFGARMRLLMEVVSSRPGADDESVLDFGRRHVGEETARVLEELQARGMHVERHVEFT